ISVCCVKKQVKKSNFLQKFFLSEKERPLFVKTANHNLNQYLTLFVHFVAEKIKKKSVQIVPTGKDRGKKQTILPSTITMKK
ncbi:hypothetical protein ACXWPE_09630, partial [Streptococcus pyogenes]